MKKSTVIFILLSFFLGLPVAFASNAIDVTDNNSKAMPYDFHLSIGRFSILQSDSTLALKDTQLNSGVAVSFTDALGLDFDHDITRLTLRYRFNPTHGMSLSWFDNESSADLQIENKLLDGSSNSENDLSTLSFNINYDISKFSYDWSLYHNDKIEVYTMLGINFMYIGSDYHIDGQRSNYGRSTGSRAPLPAFGISMNYRVNKHFYWHIKNEFFAINIDNITGSYSSFTVGAELALLEHVGLGVALYNENIDIGDKTPSYTLDYGNNFYALNFYLSSFF